MTETELQK